MTFRRRMLICICLIGLTVLFGGAAQAQGDTPQSVGEAVRQSLFDAQSALMTDDTQAAAAAVQAAQSLYSEHLRAPIQAADEQTAAQIDSGFAAAEAAARAGNPLELALARGTVWTGVLAGGQHVVFAAVERGDATTAQTWLALREFRASTKFSRPGADATRALAQLAQGTLDSTQALAAVRADLLDTYQAQLNDTLADADEAQTRAFIMRRAEEVGLAVGYFALLSDAYGEQRGTEALTDAQNTFTALANAARQEDADAFAKARAQVDTALSGFRAAPLSEVELARRAGQLVRFIALVPVEYKRGVRNGEVVKDIEIQEALTFYAGASAAFADLETALAARDADATARVDALLTQTEAQIRATADPAALDSTVQEINTVLTSLIPSEWQSVNAGSDVDVILSVLDQVETAAAQNEYALAESARLEAYAQLEFGMEQRLRGFAPDLAVQIEALFWQGIDDQPGLAVLLANKAHVSEVRASVAALKTALTDAQDYLNSAKSAPAAVAGNAAVIVFREGLEAVVILASLLASLRTAEERLYRRPLVQGALLACAATGITWWFANQLLLSMMQYGERLEAIVSLIAIGVLLLITNWFFHKVYWTGWMANFHSRKQRLVGGIAVVTISQTMGLVILGFTSIYREGFETVLFLQSLVLDAGIAVVLEGVALGLVGVAIVGVITFALQMRLPYKKMLIVTGVLIGGVLLTMVGNTVHVMQAVGWLPITPVAGLNIPFWMGQWFGLFATWQGIGLQIAALIFVVGSYFLAEYQNSGKRRTRVTQQHATV